MTEYVIRMNGEPRCKTDWPPMAQAAWDRAARDRNAAVRGGVAELEIDGKVIARVQPQTRTGHAWPVRDDITTDIGDVAAAVLQLCRAAGVSPDALAAAMGADGLPTTRSRLKSISTVEQGRRSKPSPAEVVVMCYAAIRKLRETV